MMTQNVLLQATGSSGSASGNIAIKRNHGGKNFDLLINQSIKTIKNSSGEAGTSEKAGTIAYKKAAVNNCENDSKSLHGQQKTSEKGDAVSTDLNNEGKIAVNSEDTNAKGVKDPIKKELLEQCLAMIKTIKVTIMEMLNLSEEELNQIMQEQGIDMAGLTSMDSLKQLVLANSTETDITAILTDEKLSDTMQQLLQAVDKIMTNADLPFTMEQVQGLLEHVQNIDSAVSEQVGNLLKDDTKVDKGVYIAQSVPLDDNKPTDTRISIHNDVLEEGKPALTGESAQNVKADAGGHKNENFKQPDQFQNFVDNLAQATISNKTDSVDNQFKNMQIRDIADQIIEKIKVMIKPDQTSMELQLNPESLGKINLSIQSKNGLMTAQFVVHNEISREAVESQLVNLREALDQQGIKVEAIEVTVAAYAFEQNSEPDSGQKENSDKNSSKRKISLEEADMMDELPKEDNETADITGLRGSQVDYTA